MEFYKLGSGRKREFNEEAALTAAMNVFWQKGYVGASLADLTQSMGINKPSMYRAFGNKESLFKKTTALYVDTKMKAFGAILSDTQLSLLERVRKYMLAIVAMQCESLQAKGCYLVLCQSELVSGEIPEEASILLAEIDNFPVETFSNLFKEDKESVELGLNVNAESIAISLYTVLKGTSSMARSGFRLEQLKDAIDNVLKGIFN